MPRPKVPPASETVKKLKKKVAVEAKKKQTAAAKTVLKKKAGVAALPKGAIATAKDGEEKKKKRGPAPDPDDCVGLRRGSFDRALILAKRVVFGENSARLQDELKDELQRVAEDWVVRILRDARERRDDCRSKKTDAGEARLCILGPNVIGAFGAWARIVEPKLIDEFIRLRRIEELFTPPPKPKLPKKKKAAAAAVQSAAAPVAQ